MSDDLDEFHGEAREILEGVAQDLVRLESAPGDADLVNRIFRGAHSLKGLAGMLGFTGVSQLAHKLESALDGVRMGRIAVGPPELDVMLEATEVLGQMVDAIKDGQPEREADAASAVSGRLVALATATKKSDGPTSTLEPAIAKMLSEYELHRVGEALSRGEKPWKIDVSFPFDTFDTDLPAAKERLKPYGEVVTTMPGDLSGADRMGFGLLVMSTKDPSVLLVAVAVTDAKIAAVAVVETAPGTGAGATPAPAPAASGGGAFSGFGGSGTSAFDGFGGGAPADLPATPLAAMSAGPEIDWNALSSQGNVAPEPDDGERRSGGDRRSGRDRRHAPRAPDPAALETAAPSTPAARREDVVPGAGASGSTTLRVNLERVDVLMNLVGELVTAKNAIAQVTERLKGETGFKGLTIEIYKANRVLGKRLDELQKGIMQVRMLPLDQLFSKLTRVVRNLSRESGKEVELVVEGAETEIDKVMIDELSDPLIHIVRNAVDHGIEPPAARREAGKPERGTLKIVARPKGNHVAIEIADDGGGLDAERIRTKAIQKGLLSPDATPSQEELFDFIFAAGFSTKEQVSEVSGRGVGMDVVRNNIMKLNGIIDTTSERGKGTKFTITLPLTLATMKALLVGVGGQTYAIPLASVLECVSPRASDVRTVEGRDVLPLRESTLPLVRLDRFFRLVDEAFAAGAGEPNASARVHVVVVGLAQYRIGLVVDELRQQEDVVVKPLGAPLTHVEGIMGATNLGDNKAVLVLDVAGVVNASVGATAPREERA